MGVGKLAIVVACGGFGVVGVANAAPQIANASMETATLPGIGYAYGLTGSDWTFAGGSGITHNSTAWNFTNAPDGQNVAFLQNVSSISQSITGLQAHSTYEVSYALSGRPGYDPLQVATSFGGSTIATATPVGSWARHTALIDTGAATSGMLAFATNVPTGDHDAGLDDIQIKLDQYLINGSFEATSQLPGLGYQYGVTDSRWNFTGGAGITRNITDWHFTGAPDGENVAFLQNVSSASQLVTGLLAGTTYNLDFSLSNRPGYGDIAVAVAFGGETLGTYTPLGGWSAQHLQFTATSTTGLLSFSTNMNYGDHDAGLDNVSISAVAGHPALNQVAAVPEPASWALMLGGFGLVGGAMRARRKTAITFV